MYGRVFRYVVSHQNNRAKEKQGHLLASHSLHRYLNERQVAFGRGHHISCRGCVPVGKVVINMHQLKLPLAIPSLPISYVQSDAVLKVRAFWCLRIRNPFIFTNALHFGCSFDIYAEKRDS